MTDIDGWRAYGPRGRLIVDGRLVPFEPGDTVAVAIIRAGEAPGRGGTLCLAGDCGNCLATVDGISYVRTCQTAARPGLLVERHPVSGGVGDGNPPLPEVDSTDATPPPGAATRVRRTWASGAVVVGGGVSGRRAWEAAPAGREATILDADSVAEEVVGIYPGPTVVARTPNGMHHIVTDEVIIATGSVEIQPACPGNDLRGIVTARAAERLHVAGVPLPDPVAVGTPPEGVPCRVANGNLVRFEGGTDGWVSGVVTADPTTGQETVTHCRTAIVGLGRVPRDVLARMAGPTVPVSVVGPAAADSQLPPAPVGAATVVCRCMDVTVGNLEEAWAKGYSELELLKRATLVGIGTCQGGACLPHVQAWIAARTGEAPAPFTARPAARQITLAEAAADVAIDAFRRTPLHDEHLAAGARMDRFGGWWRPWHYGDAVAEYWAVREGVSLGDVSTLGKLVVSGPDVVEALERLYPCYVADIKPGRSRYALLLNERGHVMDDGMILRESESKFVLTFTSGGAANAEMWVRDWVETWGLRVHVLDRTMSLAAINVTGPLAGELLRRAGLDDPPRFLGHRHAEVAGVPSHVMRLSFTGEASFELHHPVDRSVELWRALVDLGSDLGIRPHGLKALFGLRLEKGHVIVGMDTELDTTPRRLGMDWAVRMEKPRFIGRAALERTAMLPDQRRLFGYTMPGPAPTEGSPIVVDGAIVGHVSGSWTSPILGQAVMLGWQKRTPFSQEVEIDGRPARVSATPFYDPEGLRARA